MNTTSKNPKFLDNIQIIIDDLSHYHRDKSTLKVFYIESRLNKSLELYYKTLTTSFNYLAYRNSDNLIKKYERIIK